jgi:hypothetical protein
VFFRDRTSSSLIRLQTSLLTLEPAEPDCRIAGHTVHRTHRETSLPTQKLSQIAEPLPAALIGVETLRSQF